MNGAQIIPPKQSFTFRPEPIARGRIHVTPVNPDLLVTECDVGASSAPGLPEMVPAFNRRAPEVEAAAIVKVTIKNDSPLDSHTVWVSLMPAPRTADRGA